MKKLVCYALFLMVFIACNNDKKEVNNTKTATIDTLAFSYKTVQASYKPKELTDSTLAIITYPDFSNETLNTYIKRQVFDFFSPDEKATSYQDIVNSFINGYKDFSAEYPNRQQTWYLTININVLRQSKNYIAMAYNHEDFAGGAHGNSYTAYINYDTKNNTPIDLNTLFDDIQKKELLAIGERIFRKDEDLTTTEPLSDRYFFENGKFDLAKNFYISDKGLMFLYNNYEIKAYVNGPTELLIPFNEIKKLIKPNSFLSKLL